MARKRMIDPHIWEDPSFNELSLQARLLFIGMVSNADDEGYIRGDAGSLKRLIFGFDEIKRDEIEKWVEELGSVKNLHFFVIDDEWYAHFLRWNDYQKQKSDRIQASVYPKCVMCQTDEEQVSDKRPTDDGQVPAEVKVSKDKLSKVSILPADKPQDIKKAKQLSPIQERNVRIVNYLESSLDTKVTNWEKQMKALQMIFKAGYTEEQVTKTIDYMKNKDEFYVDKGFDLMTVMNQLPIYKAKFRARKELN